MSAIDLSFPPVSGSSVSVFSDGAVVECGEKTTELEIGAGVVLEVARRLGAVGGRLQSALD